MWCLNFGLFERTQEQVSGQGLLEGPVLLWHHKVDFYNWMEQHLQVIQHLKMLAKQSKQVHFWPLSCWLPKLSLRIESSCAAGGQFTMTWWIPNPLSCVRRRQLLLLRMMKLKLLRNSKTSHQTCQSFIFLKSSRNHHLLFCVLPVSPYMLLCSVCVCVNSAAFPSGQKKVGLTH